MIILLIVFTEITSLDISSHLCDTFVPLLNVALHGFTCPIASTLLDLKQLGEVVLQRRLCGVDVDVHVARRVLRHGVHLMVSPSRHLNTYA